MKDMFNSISSKYDLLNRLFSLNQDIYWRHLMINQIDLKNSLKQKNLKDLKILDLACGTGDVCLEIINQANKAFENQENIRLFGLDFSRNMLKIAQKKTAKKSNILLIEADIFKLPFKANIFDFITMSFGIRNLLNKLGALKIINKALKPNGKILILELVTPENKLFSFLYFIFFKTIVPLIGRLISKNKLAYSYLPESVQNFPKTLDFVELMKQAGFVNIKRIYLHFGIAVLFIGDKPI